MAVTIDDIWAHVGNVLDGLRAYLRVNYSRAIKYACGFRFGERGLDACRSSNDAVAPGYCKLHACSVFKAEAGCGWSGVNPSARI